MTERKVQGQKQKRVKKGRSRDACARVMARVPDRAHNKGNMRNTKLGGKAHC